MINVPVAVIGKAIFYPGLSFGLRGEQSIHLHHKVAGPEKTPSMRLLLQHNTNLKTLIKCNDGK